MITGLPDKLYTPLEGDYTLVGVFGEYIAIVSFELGSDRFEKVQVNCIPIIVDITLKPSGA